MMLYIHIPFCVKKCDYCDFLSFSAEFDTKERYVDMLCMELQYYSHILNDPISSIFIGGGTPTLLTIKQASKIFDEINKCFTLAENPEITIECNPGTGDKELFRELKALGVNRISIGLQSANDKELKTLGRIHSFEDFLRTYSLIRDLGIENINVDIMTGLPYQTHEILQNTLNRIISLSPNHISAYHLQIEKNTPFYEIDTSILPSEEEEDEIEKTLLLTLKNNDYHQYEISNFSKHGFECRHNCGYWKRTPYLGVGLGASSYYSHSRYTNTRELSQYLSSTSFLDKREENKLKLYDEYAEFFFLGLRMIQGVNKADFYDIFNIDVDDIYKDEIKKLKELSLLTDIDGNLRLTKRGIDVSNYALSFFLKDEV